MQHGRPAARMHPVRGPGSPDGLWGMARILREKQQGCEGKMWNGFISPLAASCCPALLLSAPVCHTALDIATAAQGGQKKQCIAVSEAGVVLP